jgi:hypothetical protein
MVKTPTFDVIIHAKGDLRSNGRWTMYVMNKDETAGKVTYYNNDTNKTHEYNIARNGGGWGVIVV